MDGGVKVRRVVRRCTEVRRLPLRLAFLSTEDAPTSAIFVCRNSARELPAFTMIASRASLAIPSWIQEQQTRSFACVHDAAPEEPCGRRDGRHKVITAFPRRRHRHHAAFLPARSRHLYKQQIRQSSVDSLSVSDAAPRAGSRSFALAPRHGARAHVRAPMECWGASTGTAWRTCRRSSLDIGRRDEGTLDGGWVIAGVGEDGFGSDEYRLEV